MAKANMKARDIMHRGAQCVNETGTLQDAARMMRDLEVGCVPICGTDNKLKGMITDRDIVITCCADGRNPADVRVSDYTGEVHWITEDADMSDVLEMMERHQIRRVPVIQASGKKELVGMISEADLARNLSDDKIAQFVGRVYAAAH